MNLLNLLRQEDLSEVNSLQNSFQRSFLGLLRLKAISQVFYVYDLLGLEDFSEVFSA